MAKNDRRFRLLPREGSETFQRIMEGRQMVGRVVKHATEPHYLGIMYKGKYNVTAPTAERAFDEVVAKSLGYASPEVPRAQNAEVQARRSVIRQHARFAMDQALHHNNFEPLMDVMLGKTDPTGRPK